VAIARELNVKLWEMHRLGVDVALHIDAHHLRVRTDDERQEEGHQDCADPNKWQRERANGGDATGFFVRR
jgi:hypothetical protein